jgi:hypothetical protein
VANFPAKLQFDSIAMVRISKQSKGKKRPSLTPHDYDAEPFRSPANRQRLKRHVGAIGREGLIESC